MPIGKTELAQQVAEQAGLNKAQAGRAVDAVLNTIRDTLAHGDEPRPVRSRGSSAGTRSGAGTG